jgi:thiosulfate dehydrogenase [quinone] large subunit
MSRDATGLSSGQQVSLVLLRTLIGWHFLYEGYFKLLWPAWGRDGEPLPHWTSAGYLKAAVGPFAGFFHGLAQSQWLSSIDMFVAFAVFGVGLSLVLGLFTDLGCAGALVLLSLFYLSSIPTQGLPTAHAEGTYLLVNKNLVEAGAVLVLLAFGTGRIAGLDRLRAMPPAVPARAKEIPA